MGGGYHNSRDIVFLHNRELYQQLWSKHEIFTKTDLNMQVA